MKFAKADIKYETAETFAFAVPKRSKYSGYVALVEKSQCLPEGDMFAVKDVRLVVLKPYEDRTKRADIIPIEELEALYG